jgi:hypothetical protein
LKLILCSTCKQVFSLSHDYTECKGGHAGGQYIDDINAKIWGDSKKIFVLGFANSSFVSALRDQLNHGDLPKDFHYAGQVVTKGRYFTAFVIPASAPSIVRVDERFDPVVVPKKS